MPRSSIKRWWIPLIVLALFATGVFSLPGSGFANVLSGGGMVDDGSGARDPGTSPQATGDPDSPSVAGRGNTARPGGMGGAVGPGGALTSTRSGSPDGVTVSTRQQRIWIYRIQVGLRMLRAFYLR